jgi:hypothetical protein
MPSEALAKYGTIVKPTLSLASVTSSGAGRVSALVDNTTVRAPMATIYLKVTTGGTAPTANTPIKVYLIRRSNDGTSDLVESPVAVTTDAAVSSEPVNAELLGSIAVTNATNATYIKAFLAYDLPSEYQVLVWNATGQGLNGTPSNHELQIQPTTMEAQ